MPALKTLIPDPKQRMLALLGAAALIGILLAGLAVHLQSARTAPQSTVREFLPDFGAKVRQATRIHFVSKTGTFDIVFKPQKGWVLPASADYPASVDEVRQLLVGLAGLQTIEPKTSRADWLSFVGLDAPPQGGGLAITIFNDKGETLTSILVGKASDIGDKNGASGLFVRKPDSNESWLVRSVFVPSNKAIDWMDKTVVDMGRDRIKSVDVDPEGGQSFTVARAAADVPSFSVTPIPAGRELQDNMAAFGVTDALADFMFDDIQPIAEFDFTKSSRMVFRTFDGLMVTVRTIKKGEEYWASIEASPIAGMPAAQKEARDIGAHAHGWAYKLQSYKGAQFMPTLESILKPKAEKK